MMGEKEERDARCELPEASGRATESVSSCTSTQSKAYAGSLPEKIVQKPSFTKHPQRNSKDNSPTREKTDQPKVKIGEIGTGTDMGAEAPVSKSSQGAPPPQITNPPSSKEGGKRDRCESDTLPYDTVNKVNIDANNAGDTLDKPSGSQSLPTLPPMATQHQPPRPTPSPPPIRSMATSRRGGLRSGTRSRSPPCVTPRGIQSNFSMTSPPISSPNSFVAAGAPHDQGTGRASGELATTNSVRTPGGTSNVAPFSSHAEKGRNNPIESALRGTPSPTKDLSTAAANAAAAASASLATMQMTPSKSNQGDEQMKLSDASFSPIDREDDLQEFLGDYNPASDNHRAEWPVDKNGNQRSSHQEQDTPREEYNTMSQASAAEPVEGHQDNYGHSYQKRNKDGASSRSSPSFSSSLSTRGRNQPNSSHRLGHATDDRGHPNRHESSHHRRHDRSFVDERRDGKQPRVEKSRSRDYHREDEYRGMHVPRDGHRHRHSRQQKEAEPYFERNPSFPITASSSYQHHDDRSNSPPRKSAVPPPDASSVFRGRGPLSPPMYQREMSRSYDGSHRPRHSFDERGGPYHSKLRTDEGHPYPGSSHDLSPVDPPQIQHMHRQRALSPQTFLLEKNLEKSPGMMGPDGPGGIASEEIDMTGSFGLFNQSFDEHSFQEAGMPPLDVSFNQICGSSPGDPTPPHTPPYYHQGGRSPGLSLSRNSRESDPLTPRGISPGRAFAERDISLPPFRKSSSGVPLHLPETPPTHYRSSSDSTARMFERCFDPSQRNRSPSPSFSNHDISTPSSRRLGHPPSYSARHRPGDASPRYSRHQQFRSYPNRSRDEVDYNSRSRGRGLCSDSYSLESPPKRPANTRGQHNPNTPPRHITSRSYKIDREKFYRVLRNSSRAFERCTFLLPGVTSKANDLCNASPSRGAGEDDSAINGPDKQKAAFMPEPATSNHIVGWPSPAELTIAKRRVVSAICAFGGNMKRKDDSSKPSIFRTKEEDQPAMVSSSDKYAEKLQKRFYENENRLSWEVEEKPPVEIVTDDEGNDSSSKWAKEKNKKGKSHASKKEDENTADGSPSSSTTKSPDTPNPMGRFLFLAGAEPPKMRYRCKLCGQPKQNHSCPYRQSLQRSIGIMVYPAINAFISSEPGVLAPALSEMNNFVDKKESDLSSIEASPARSIGFGRYDNTPSPHRITPGSIRGAAHLGRSSVGSNGQVYSPQSSLSAGSLHRGGGRSRKRLHSQVSGDVGSNASLASHDLSAETPLFLDTMEIKPEQFRMVTPVTKKAKKGQPSETSYQYPSLPVPYKQRKRVSDSLFALSKEIPQLTDECADVLREARAMGMWDTAIAELMTQIIIGMRCQDGDNTLNGLSQYLLTIGIAC